MILLNLISRRIITGTHNGKKCMNDRSGCEWVRMVTCLIHDSLKLCFNFSPCFRSDDYIKLISCLTAYTSVVSSMGPFQVHWQHYFHLVNKWVILHHFPSSIFQNPPFYWKFIPFFRFLIPKFKFTFLSRRRLCFICIFFVSMLIYKLGLIF